jgi:lipopolysaccharide biosynthesis glycosyltransferase
MTQPRAVCTIIAKNYLAFARTLVQSCQSHNPDVHCYVLIVDDSDDLIDPAQESFEVIRLSDLDIPDLSSLCFKYDVKELCTAVKAHLLGYLIRQKAVERLLYLDPDIMVAQPLDHLFEKLETSDIVLTPHLDRDYPDDDLLPNDGYILRAGQFNLGFIGINSSANAGAFLNWWQPKLLKHCVVDLLNGYFVDQKFIDFAPLFFENVLVEKDAGYNSGYWNLHSRRFRKVNGSWRCNDGPLYFYHFSGYQPASARITSHIPDSMARYRFSNRKDVRKLFAEYESLLMQNGYQESSGWPYGFGYFASGEPVLAKDRSYYRSLPAPASLGDPFSSERLKRHSSGLPEGESGVRTHAEQLDAILNSRAWRWVSRYGRFKHRYLLPPYRFLLRLFGRDTVI